MKRIKFLYLVMAALLCGSALVSAAETKSATKKDTSAAAPADSANSTVGAVDEDWLNTVWTQVDDVVKQEELKLQETVTVAGVRGAEAEDNLLDKLYYKGGKRYPSQDKLKKAIDTLKQGITKDPKGKEAPKLKYFVAQCYEKIGNVGEAKNFYTQVTKDHPKSKYATPAQESLKALAAAKSSRPGKKIARATWKVGG